MSDDDQTKPKSPRASILVYLSSRASRHTNEIEPTNQTRQIHVCNKATSRKLFFLYKTIDSKSYFKLQFFDQMFYGSSNLDSMSLYSLNSLCYEINPAQQQQPRLSDGHLQYNMKLANFSRAGTFEQQEQPSTRLFHSHSHNHIVSMHETEV